MTLRGKRIFIVEDDVFNRSIEQYIWELQGAKIESDRWGDDTIQRLRAFKVVDLIILDLMLPNGVTGFDVFKQIRSHAEFNYVPIIAVSAKDPTKSILLTRQHGFDGFVSKAVDYFLFPRQITDVINGQKVWYQR